MANINVKKRLESIAGELAKVLQHVNHYSGVDKKDAWDVDNRCAEIAEMSTRIAETARLVQGNSSGKTVVKKVRKALGYAKP